MRKSKEEVAKMRRAGRVVAQMLEACERAAKPGVTTRELDLIARDVLERNHARSNFLNYKGFPAVICTSPNSVIVHGIPSNQPLKDGDILSVDCGAIIEGYHADAARTFPIGDVDEDAHQLMKVTRASLDAGIEFVRDGARVSDIGEAVQKVAEAAGFSVVREYVGHGIGTALHEEPQVPNYKTNRRGIKLMVGHVLAVEPMVNMGGPKTELRDDGWTVVTLDGSLSAHFEDSIAVTENGPEILTRLD